MKRREFITLLGGAAAWPLAPRAQQPVMPVIGGLYGVSEAQWRGAMAGFRRGLGGRGWAMVCTADAASPRRIRGDVHLGGAGIADE